MPQITFEDDNHEINDTMRERVTKYADSHFDADAHIYVRSAGADLHNGGMAPVIFSVPSITGLGYIPVAVMKPRSASADLFVSGNFSKYNQVHGIGEAAGLTVRDMEQFSDKYGDFYVDTFERQIPRSFDDHLFGITPDNIPQALASLAYSLGQHTLVFLLSATRDMHYENFYPTVRNGSYEFVVIDAEVTGNPMSIYRLLTPFEDKNEFSKILDDLYFYCKTEGEKEELNQIFIQGFVDSFETLKENYTPEEFKEAATKIEKFRIVPLPTISFSDMIHSTSTKANYITRTMVKTQLDPKKHQDLICEKLGQLIGFLNYNGLLDPEYNNMPPTEVRFELPNGPSSLRLVARVQNEDGSPADTFVDISSANKEIMHAASTVVENLQTGEIPYFSYDDGNICIDNKSLFECNLPPDKNLSDSYIYKMNVLDSWHTEGKFEENLENMFFSEQSVFNTDDNELEALLMNTAPIWESRMNHFNSSKLANAQGGATQNTAEPLQNTTLPLAHEAENDFAATISPSLKIHDLTSSSLEAAPNQKTISFPLKQMENAATQPLSSVKIVDADSHEQEEKQELLTLSKNLPLHPKPPAFHQTPSIEIAMPPSPAASHQQSKVQISLREVENFINKPKSTPPMHPKTPLSHKSDIKSQMSPVMPGGKN